MWLRILSPLTTGLLLAAVLAAASWGVPTAEALSTPPNDGRRGSDGDGGDNVWWRTGVVYQIYPRSFLDGCEPSCTGVGSLIGITRQIPFLVEDLGVDAIWISPIYDSPMADFGYDISNFTGIWPTFGTMGDFDNLMKVAKAHKLRVIMDFVPNHSSNAHPWFINSASARNATRRDWYIWRNGTTNSTTGEPIPPNNWRSVFCKNKSDCSAWAYDKTTDQWYYHCFLEQQPDLNWRNPDVVEAMHNVLRFWLDKGVDGFRVDAFPNILEDPQLRDEPINPDWDGEDGYSKLLHIYTENVKGLHEVVRGMRSVLDEYEGEKFMVGEIYADAVVTEKDVISYYGTEEHPEFSMPFNMALIGFFDYEGTFDSKAKNDPTNATRLREMVDGYDAALPSWAQPNYVLGNHDVTRIRTRLRNLDFARAAYSLLFGLRGTPTVYNGDEIGQADGYVPYARHQDPNCADPSSRRCRDPERTPLQWNTTNHNAGFSGDNIETWLPVSLNYITTNYHQQLDDPSSMLFLFKRALRLRKQYAELHSGAYKSFPVATLPAGNTVFAFRRGTPEKGRFFVVIANIGAEPVTVDVCKSISDQERVERVTVVLDSRDYTQEGTTTLLQRVDMQGNHTVFLEVRTYGAVNLTLIYGVSIGIGLALIIAFNVIACRRRLFTRKRTEGYRLVNNAVAIDE